MAQKQLAMVDQTPGNIHIIGCGNIGQRVASLCLEAEKDAVAWVKSEASSLSCQHMGLEVHRTDLDQPSEFKLEHSQSRILYTIPPAPHGTKDTRLRALLKQLDAGMVQKFILISTTGVYGDCAGAWVDESTPLNPKADRALRRVDAEECLQTWADHYAVDYLILRVPGIYSPDRLPLKRLKSGTPMVTESEAPWTNRIHADDLANICFSALNSQVRNEIVNVADDSPSRMTAYFIAVADYAGLPHPPEISLKQARLTLSPGMLSYLVESRRIRNTKMKTLLNVKLRYPTLKQGLASISKSKN